MAPVDLFVDPLTLCSLLLELRSEGNSLAIATGFVAERDGRKFLFSNWHVLSGRDPDTGQPLSRSGATPDEVVIFHHTVFQHEGSRATGWVPITQPLFTGSRPLWIEHPDGAAVDVAALGLTRSDKQIAVYPIDLALVDTDILVGVGMPVSVVGYPFGLTAGALFPIWKTGHVASEPDVDFDAKPIFLVDATTRSGMSGSPVYYRFGGHGYRTRKGVAVVAPGTFSVKSEQLTRFLGVYAGRIHDSVEIGRIWKPRVVKEILDRAASQSPMTDHEE